MYATAQGVPLDYTEAHKWFILAEGNGDAASRENLKHSVTLMTASQITEAQRRAKEWTRIHANKPAQKRAANSQKPLGVTSK